MEFRAALQHGACKGACESGPLARLTSRCSRRHASSAHLCYSRRRGAAERQRWANMRKLRNLGRIALIGAAVVACNAQRDEGVALVSKIGASRLVAEVQALRPSAPSSLSPDLSAASWPASVRELAP